MPPPPGSSPRDGDSLNAPSSPSPIDPDNSNSNSNSSPSNPRRLSKDSEGYPSWLPKRPPPPAPASTFQSSILGASGLYGSTPSPVQLEGEQAEPEAEAGPSEFGAGGGASRNPFAWIGGRKPTPRSVRIVSLHDSFVGAVEKDAARSVPGPSASREPTDQTLAQEGVSAPPKVKVWSRASGAVPASAFTSAHEEVLPLPQPRFNAKNLHLQILRSPSRWMKAYFYAWPLLCFYHIPLQTFLDFNAVFVLLQVAKYPNPDTSGKNWALGAAAYIACWLAWIFVVFLLYELVYSFSRRWRLRRPLMLPIFLSSPAFSYASMTSYTNFCFLQHLRISAFLPEQGALAPLPLPSSSSDDGIYVEENHDAEEEDDEPDGAVGWQQGLAETCSLYAQNLPTVALLLPRAGLCLALLLSFSSPDTALLDLVTNAGLSTSNLSNRDSTFFRQNGTGVLTDYARGVLIANAVWTAWRVCVLLASWLGLWLFSNQRLAGLCGPRHTWEESAQEKTRSVYSEAASEYGAYRSSFYQGGNTGYNRNPYGNEEAREYGGDELPWEWREATRMRVQDVFEFCLTSPRSSHHQRGSTSAAGPGAHLRWSTASGVPPSAYGPRDRRYGYHGRNGSRHHHKRRSSAKGKEPSYATEKPDIPHAQEEGEGFEGIERVLAAVGFPSGAPSPARRGVLSKDLFAAPEGITLEDRERKPTVEPLQYGPQPSMFTGLEAPKMAKRNSKDKIPGSSTAQEVHDAPLLSLPYPFSRPGAGQVSSKDLVPFPGASGSKKSGKSKTGSGSSKSGSKSGTGTISGSEEEKSGSGSAEEEEEEDEEDEEEDDEEEEEDEEENEEEAFEDSEELSPSSGRASGSMSSLGQPLTPNSRYPFGMRRPMGAAAHGHGHGRSMSGVSSALTGSGSGAHSHNMSMSSAGGAVSVVTQSTGNPESTDSEFGLGGRERASLSQGSSSGNGNGIPMPPRHPHPHGQGRGRSSTLATTNTSSGSSSAAAAAAALAVAGLTNVSMHAAPVAFPSVHQRNRVDSGRGIVIDPAVLYGIDMEDDEDEHPVADTSAADSEQHHIEDVEEETHGEHEDRVGLLGLPSSARNSRVSLTNSSSGSGSQGRSPTNSFSRSRHSSTHARSRTRTHSSTSVRERANSLGASMRSLMHGAASASLTSLTQLDSIMRGATGPAAGLGGFGGNSRPRSRVNSSMARLEEEVVFSPSETEMGERGRGVSGASTGSGNSGSQSQSHSGGSGSGVAVLNPLVGRTRRELAMEAEDAAGGYASSRSAGSHSRSGSEAENYTFGRPIPFMRPQELQHQHQQDTVQEEDGVEDEIVLVERTSGSAGRGSPRSRVPSVVRADQQHQRRPQPQPEPGSQPQSLSVSSISESMSFYSPQPSERTASPHRGTPVPIHLYRDDALNRNAEHSPSPPQSTSDHSPERQGVAIPWTQTHSQPQRGGFLALPPRTAAGVGIGRGRQVPISSGSTPTTGSGGSPPDISTAAGSFVTAPVTLDGATTAATESTVSIGSGVAPGRRGEVGGMVERPGDDLGAGGAWGGRVV